MNVNILSTVIEMVVIAIARLDVHMIYLTIQNEIIHVTFMNAILTTINVDTVLQGVLST